MSQRNGSMREAQSQRISEKKRSRKIFLFLYLGIFLVAIGIFSIFRWAMPSKDGVIENPNKKPSPSPSASVAADTRKPSSQEPSATPPPTPKPVTKTDDSYDSEKLSFSISKHEEEIGGRTVKYFVADIQLKDMSLFGSAFSGDGKSISNQYENPVSIAEKHGGLLAINCDNSGYLADGIIVRNGELYRFKPSNRDCCLIFSDGTMEIASEKSFSSQDEIFGLINEKGLLHSYSFGPYLLNNGKGRDDYSDSTVQRANPRTAIGMIAPYHYVFVIVDGRTDDSAGLSLKDLEQLMTSLGCQVAYNFDGGQSSILIYDGKILNNIAGRDEPRGVTDIVYLSEN